MGIQFKLRDGVTAEQLTDIEQIVAAAAPEPTVRPLFPGEEDPELALLYRVEGVPPERESELVEQLSRHQDVEFAEPDARRKLIR